MHTWSYMGEGNKNLKTYINYLDVYLNAHIAKTT